MSDQELSPQEAALYALVPVEGTTIGNRRAQRELRWSESVYWPVRDSLVDMGLIAIGRGKGGSLRRIVDTVPAEVLSVPVEIGESAVQVAQVVEALFRREEELYVPLAAVLRGDWARDRRSSPLAVEIIARQGRRATGGIWSRPDLVTIEIRKPLYVPTKIIEVVTFEVKTSDSIDVQAVYEALAHRRSSTHAYVILHVPGEQALALDENIQIVCAVARSHGVGVITVGDPADYSTWDELERAERVEPDPMRLDHFISTQLSETIKIRIAQELR